jgi:ABC-2 type transport system ATP-binding protein
MRKLGKKQLTLQLQAPISELPAKLADFNLSLGKDGHAITYTYDTRGERTGITRLLQGLSDAGIRFRDLQTTESSLEDIFVKLVREPQ